MSSAHKQIVRNENRNSSSSSYTIVDKHKYSTHITVTWDRVMLMRNYAAREEGEGTEGYQQHRHETTEDKR